MVVSALKYVLWEEDILLENSREILGSSLGLVDAIHLKYDALLETYFKPIREGLKVFSSEEKVIAQSLLSCRRQLIIGVVNLLRGHEADSTNNLRRALEYTIFACYVFEVAGAADKWLDADSSEEAWQAYRDVFKILPMVDSRRFRTWKHFNSEMSLLCSVLDDYELCSRKVHATVVSAGPIKEEGREVFYGPLIDVKPLREAESLTDPFYNALFAHLRILELQFLLMSRTSFSLELDWPNCLFAIKSEVVSQKEDRSSSSS